MKAEVDCEGAGEEGVGFAAGDPPKEKPEDAAGVDEEDEVAPKDGVVEPKEKEGVPFERAFGGSGAAGVVPNEPKVLAESGGADVVEDDGVLRAAKGLEEAANAPPKAEGF